MTRNRSFAVAAAVSLAFGAATTAEAATVTLTNIKALWFNGTPVANVTVAPPGLADTTTAYWGGEGGIDNGDSGYRFNAVDSGVTFNVVVPGSDGPDLVGDFTHFNNPIPAGTSITSIQLRVQADIAVDMISQGTKEFIFNFGHWETDNDPRPAACADGGTYGFGVNANGCADKVTISYNLLSDTFNVGGTAYTLLFKGFSTDGGLNVSNGFWTKEDDDNVAGLWASVVTRKDAESEVPLPAAGWLLLSGLAGLGVFGRRRSTVAS